MKHQTEAILKLEEKLIRLNYSWQTVKTYKSCFQAFLRYYSGKEVQEITKAEIESYLVHLIREKGIAPSTQNQIINAIKFYYEKVLYHPQNFITYDDLESSNHFPMCFPPKK